MADIYFQVFVALPTEDVCTVRDVTSDMRIFQLKSRVELKTGIPGDIQHLHFMNKELYDDLTLKDVKLKQGCIVRVKLDSNWQSLFDACWRGDIYEVFQNGVQFLDEGKFQGYNIALWNRLVIQRANHALFISSHRGYLGLVLEILNHSAADINGKTRFGRTALHMASYQGFVGCVSLLLSEGALCNQVDFNGKTALTLASENGHVYCERRLWLYQLSLKAFNQSGSRRDSVDSGGSQETAESLSWRFTNRSFASTSKGKQRERLNGDDSKKIQLRLPSVQTSNSRSNSPPAQQGHRAQFPLVQIAEKYREELQTLEESNFPDVNDRQHKSEKLLSPQTAQGPLQIIGEGTGSRDAVEQVQNANCGNLPAENRDQTSSTDEGHQSQPIIGLESLYDSSTRKANTQIQENLSSADQKRTDSPGSSSADIIKERPVSAKPHQLRKLDVVMSISREKESNEAAPSSEDLLSVRLPNDKESSSNSEISIDVSENAYRRRKPAQTFDNWLEMKRNQSKLRPATANAQTKSKLGKSIDSDAFKEWLCKKRQNQYRSPSESSNSGSRKSFISSGLTFDQWLENKAKTVGKDSHVTDANNNEGGNVQKKSRTVMAGKSYEEWLNEKLKQAQEIQSTEDGNEGGKNVSKSGKSFEVWLLEKRKQKQIEVIHKATTEKLEQKRLEFEQYQRYLNPHYKTFDEWLAIKKHENLLERFRAENDPTKSEDIPKEEKAKDSNLVFHIWLTMKYVEEMKIEEENYREMVEKWERKEKERSQLRRALLASKTKNNFINTSGRDKRHVRAKSAAN